MIYRFCFNVKQETTPQINPFRMIFHHSTVANPKNPQKNTAWRRSGNWLKLWAPGSWTNMAPS